MSCVREEDSGREIERKRERETCTLARRERDRVKHLYKGYYLCEVKQRELPAFMRAFVTNVLAPGLTSV